MVAPHARYNELFERRQQTRAGGPAFSAGELRDLQVWHKLVWIDAFYTGDPRIAALYAKGDGFSEADKAVLREVESVRVTRDWPRSVRVVVVERTPVLAVPGPGGYQLTDRFGVSWMVNCSKPR